MATNVEVVKLEIGKLDLQAGDLFVVRVPNSWTVIRIKTMNDFLKGFVPEGVKCMVLTSDMTIDVVRKA